VQPEPRPALPSYLDQPPLRHATPKVIVEHPRLTEASDDYVGEPLAPAPPPTAPVPVQHHPAPPAPSVEATTDAGARFREALANLHSSGHPRYEPGVGAVENPQGPTPTLRPPVPTGREEQVAPSTEAGMKFREALANLHRSGHPRYESPSESGPSGSPPAAPAPEPAPARAPLAQQPETAADGLFGEPRLTHRRRTLAETRKLGLGAPVQGGAPSEQPEPDPSPAPAATPASEQTAPSQPESMLDALEAVKRAAAAAQPVAPLPPIDVPTPTPAPPSSGPETPGDGGGGTAVRAPLQPRVPGRPIIDPATRPTASAAPLIFRGAPRPPAPDTTPPGPQTQRAVVTRPPAELAAALRASHGIDVVDVPIRRDTEVEREAAARNARAFTRGATVHLPESAGGLDDRNTLGLLAHELVHAAQQRRLGSSLPPETSPEGHALEVEALAAERVHGGTPASLTSDEPLRHAPPPVSAGWVEDRLTQHAFGDYKLPTQPAWEETSKEVETIKAWAQKVIQEAQAAGGVGGAGGGGLSTFANLNEANIGGTGAKNEADFKKIMLEQVNKERGMQGLPALTSLTAEYDAWAHNEYLKAEADRKRALDHEQALKSTVATEKELQDQALEAKKKATTQAEEADRLVDQAAKKGEELKGITWTPDGGFKRTDGSDAKGQVAAALAGLLAAEEGSPEHAAAAATAGRIEITKAHGGGAEKDPTADVHLTAVEKWEIKRDNKLFKIDIGEAKGINTAADYIAFALARTNRERAERSLPAIDRLPDAFERELEQQFTSIWNVAVADELKKAKDLDLDTQSQATALAAKKQTALAKAKQDEEEGKAKQAVVAEGPTPIIAAAPTAPAESAGPAAQTAVLPHELDSAHLEELTQRIYDRLRSRLRTELLIDRERAGLLTDFR
jgi:Domain of unknown function (DUF4157)